MSNFSDTIKNVITLMKNKLKEKADLNKDNLFKGDISINKRLLVNNGRGTFIDIYDSIKKMLRNEHTHTNKPNLDLINEKLINDEKILSYNNIAYQPKFEHDINTGILSKFTQSGNTLYWNGLKVIDPDSISQKTFKLTNKINNTEEVINISDIVLNNNIKAIMDTEIIITNTSDVELEVVLTNNDITSSSSTFIPAGTTHTYSIGINQNNLITMNGTFEYYLTINYF